VNITVVCTNGEDTGDGIIGGIGLDYGRKRRIEMMKYGGRCERILEEPERVIAGGRPEPRLVLAGQLSKRDSYI
jgi:hypothetical protein